MRTLYTGPTRVRRVFCQIMEILNHYRQKMYTFTNRFKRRPCPKTFYRTFSSYVTTLCGRVVIFFINTFYENFKTYLNHTCHNTRLIFRLFTVEILYRTLHSSRIVHFPLLTNACLTVRIQTANFNA
jgi:hypothetical protein